MSEYSLSVWIVVLTMLKIVKSGRAVTVTEMCDRYEEETLRWNIEPDMGLMQEDKKDQTALPLSSSLFLSSNVYNFELPFQQKRRLHSSTPTGGKWIACGCKCLKEGTY